MWKRAAAAVAGIVCGGPLFAGSQATRTINRKRYRYFADDYTLTPEHLGMTYHSVKIRTSDDITLNGWFIPKTKQGIPVSRLAMICHPRNSDKSNMIAMAKEIFDSGYSVFMFGFRSFADTPTRQTIGYLEQRDARAALEFVMSYRHMQPQFRPNNKDTNEEEEGEEEIDIVLVGGSLGGAMSLMLADHPRVQAVVADCAFSSLPNAIRNVVRSNIEGAVPFVIPEVVMEPFMDASMLVTRWLTEFIYGYDINSVSPMAKVAELTDTPVLLIHSKDDTYILVDNVYKLYNSATKLPESHKSIKIVAGDHLSGYFHDPNYTKDVVNFLDNALALRKKERMEKAKMEKERMEKENMTTEEMEPEPNHAHPPSPSPQDDHNAPTTTTHNTEQDSTPSQTIDANADPPATTDSAV